MPAQTLGDAKGQRIEAFRGAPSLLTVLGQSIHIPARL